METPVTQRETTLFVTLRVPQDKVEAFKQVHRPLWQYCAREPECLLFDVFQEANDPGRFRFVEVWNGSREWVETQQLTKPYYSILWNESQPLWIEDIKIEWYERTGEGFCVKQRYIDGDTERI